MGKPKELRIREAIHILPDLLRLLKNLNTDHDMARGFRILLVLFVAFPHRRSTSSP